MAIIDLTSIDKGSINSLDQGKEASAFDLAVVGLSYVNGLDANLLKQTSAPQFMLSSFGGSAAQVVVQGVVTVITGSTTYWKRGFRLATGQYEYWRTNVRDNGPPSGNALVDITVTGEVNDC